MITFHFNNYAPQSVSDKGKTHEETFGFTRASLRSVAEYTFTGKSIRFAQSLRAINDFPKFSLRENFCKLHIVMIIINAIEWNLKNAIHNSKRQRTI
jgi:hypothetical protein